MAHPCVDCGDECDCLGGEAYGLNCGGCGCDFTDGDDDDLDDEEAEF